MQFPSDNIVDPEIFDAIFEHTPIGVFVLDSEQKMIKVNSALCKALNYTVEEFLALDVRELSHPDDLGKNIETLKSIYKGSPMSKSEGFGYRFLDSKGKTIHGEIKEKVIRDQQGNVKYLVAMATNITSLVQNTDIMNLRSEEFSLLFENGFDGIVIYDSLLGRPVNWNKKILDFFGCDAETFVGESLLYFSPEYQPNGKTSLECQIELREILQKEERHSFEWLHKRPDGSLFYAEISTFKLPRPHQQYRVSILRDATDKKRSQQALQQSEERLNLALEAGELGTWEWDMTTDKTTYNKRWASMLGYDLSELQNNYLTFKNIVHPEDYEKCMQAIDEHIKTKSDFFEIEVRMFAKDGSTRWIYDRGKVTATDQDGRPTRMNGIHIDMTKQKENALALERSERQLKEAQEIAKVGHWEFDVKTQETYWSEAIARMLGLNPEAPSLDRDAYLQLIHPDDRQSIVDAFVNTIKTGKGYVRESRKVLNDGRTIYTISKGVPFRRNGKVVKLYGTMQDITEQKLNEIKREQLLNELEAVNKELKDFAYIVSHDLKAPLRAIGLLTQWLLEDHKKQLDQTGQEHLNLLHSRVNRMHGFIDGILEYSRIGRKKENITLVDLNTVASNTKNLLNVPAHFKIKIPKLLPKIKVDQLRMEQLFQNLISNAIKYNDKEEGLLVIAWQESNHYYQFSFTDNGPGIDEKYHTKVFQIFQTLQSRDNFESTGIGLTIVRKIVETYGGRIWLEAHEGSGAKFVFTIPKGF